MKITDKYEMSVWALNQCIVNNSEEFVDLINDQLVAYVYHKYIKYNKCLRKKISRLNWKYFEKYGVYYPENKWFRFEGIHHINNHTRATDIYFDLDKEHIKEYIKFENYP